LCTCVLSHDLVNSDFKVRSNMVDEVVENCELEVILRRGTACCDQRCIVETF
jgi:hypothetical protein